MGGGLGPRTDARVRSASAECGPSPGSSSHPERAPVEPVTYIASASDPAPVPTPGCWPTRSAQRPGCHPGCCPGCHPGWATRSAAPGCCPG